jgi:hypothetical protein
MKAHGSPTYLREAVWWEERRVCFPLPNPPPKGEGERAQLSPEGGAISRRAVPASRPLAAARGQAEVLVGGEAGQVESLAAR